MPPALPPAPRSVLFLCAAFALAGCTQDEASSNPQDRDTHMGDIHVAAPPAPPSAQPAAAAPAAPPAAAPSAAPAPAPAPSGSH